MLSLRTCLYFPLPVEVHVSRFLCKVENQVCLLRGSTPFASSSGRNRPFPLSAKSDSTSLWDSPPTPGWALSEGCSSTSLMQPLCRDCCGLQGKIRKVETCPRLRNTHTQQNSYSQNESFSLPVATHGATVSYPALGVSHLFPSFINLYCAQVGQVLLSHLLSG